MHSKKPDYAAILNRALANYHAGIDPALIELPEGAVFPHLIPAQPATVRKSRCTGSLFGKPTPRFIRRGRSIRYRLKDVFDWLESADSFSSTADAVARGEAK